jgi:nucleotide-binding universal stress UspA family protein
MYQNILLPTDGSEGTEAALGHALDLATTYGATIHVVYVIDTTIGADAGGVTTLDALETIGEDAVDRALQRARATGIDTVEESVLRGTPHRTLIEYADEHDVDLIVMGTHGRTGLERYLIGSVTEKVVRLADVPVLTVPLTDEGGKETAP